MILYDGVIKQGDTVLALSIDGVQKSKLKSILKPGEMKEIRDSATKFKTIPEQQAASGVKLACPDFGELQAGMPIIAVRKNEKQSVIDEFVESLEKEITDSNIVIHEQGILVKADTLGSLEALSFILEEHNIPLRKAEVGKVTKMDVMDAGADLKHNPKNALILNFSQKIDPVLEKMAEESGVTIFSHDIIYKLIEESAEWLKNKQKEIDRQILSELTMPFKIKILPNCIFRVSGPAVVGVEVQGGSCIPNVSLMTKEGKRGGSIKTIKDRDETLSKLEFEKQAAVSMDDVVIGKNAEEGTVFLTFMGEENFRNLKDNKELLSSDERKCLADIADVMRVENSLWGK